MKKKINVIFAVITALIALACIVHTAIRYYQIANDQMTSAPASVAFFLIIPYAIALIVNLVVWFLVRKYRRRQSEK